MTWRVLRTAALTVSTPLDCSLQLRAQRIDYINQIELSGMLYWEYASGFDRAVVTVTIRRHPAKLGSRQATRQRARNSRVHIYLEVNWWCVLPVSLNQVFLNRVLQRTNLASTDFSVTGQTLHSRIT